MLFYASEPVIGSRLERLSTHSTVISFGRHDLQCEGNTAASLCKYSVIRLRWILLTVEFGKWECADKMHEDVGGKNSSR